MLKSPQGKHSQEHADTSSRKILHQLLDRTFPFQFSASDCFKDWRHHHYKYLNEWVFPIDQAIIGGFLADRIGFAFAAGFQSALHHLIPSLPRDQIVSFCISEEKGSHPRYIKTELRPVKNQKDQYQNLWTVHGEKKWTTLACEADILIVAASIGESQTGLNRIQMVKVEKDSSGLSIQSMDSISFVPEISHGQVKFEQVPVSSDNFFPGDGYTDYIKPFRTMEDIYSLTAILGYIFKIASQYDWPRTLQEEILHLITSLRSLAFSEIMAPEIHIVLGGVLAHQKELLGKIDPYWAKTDSTTQERWKRDKELFKITSQAHSIRLESAWKHF